MPKKEIKVEIVAETKNAEGKLATVSAALKSVANDAARASKQAGKIDDSGMKKMASSADGAKKRVKSLGDELSKASAMAGKLGKVVQGLGSLATGAFAKDIVNGLLGAGAASIKAAAQMRQYEIAFQTMLKSADEGTQMLRDLQKFAAETPFDVPGVVSAGQQLMAFGFKAKEVIPMLTSLGDAAAGLGQGTAGVSRLAYALGQMQTSGKLNAQDMMQLTSAGISAWDMLADAAGVSIAEIKDMTSKGMVDSKEAVKVIVAGMNEEFGGMMAKTSTEVSGLLANIEETAGTTSAVIGQYMINAFNIKGILQTASSALGDFQTKLQNAANSGESFRDVIKDCIPPELIAAAVVIAALETLGYGAPPLGIWIDVEAPEVIGQDPDDVTAISSAFISTCNAAGYSAGIYASLSTLIDCINVNDLADYVPYWCAQYGTSECGFLDSYPDNILAGWQWTDCYSIGGENYDMSEWY